MTLVIFNPVTRKYCNVIAPDETLIDNVLRDNPGFVFVKSEPIKESNIRDSMGKFKVALDHIDYSQTRNPDLNQLSTQKKLIDRAIKDLDFDPDYFLATGN